VQSTELRHDIDTRPVARLQLTTPTTSYSFGYAPSFTVLALGAEEGDLVVSQSADVSAQVRSERVTFTVSEGASYGQRNFQALIVSGNAGSVPAGTTPGTGTPPTGTPPPTGGTPPPMGGGGVPTGQTAGQLQTLSQTITYGSSISTASLQYLFAPLTLGTALAGYEYSGGFNAASEQFLPVRRGPFATLALRYRATRTDDFTTSTNGSSLDTGSTLHAQIVDVGEEWLHRWDPSVVTTIRAGVALARAEADGVPHRLATGIVPVSSASLLYGFGLAGGKMRTTALLQFAPIIDRFTGDLDQRLQWGIDLNWTRFDWSLLGNLSGAQSVLPSVVFSNTQALPFNYYSGSASVMYRLRRDLSMEGGLRAAWVRVAGDDPYPLLWSVFLAGTYTMHATYL
jgi:hypothetical protein